MMNVTYSPSILGSEPLRRVAEKATRVLESVVGRGVANVSVEWDRDALNRKDEYLYLTLSKINRPVKLTRLLAIGELNDSRRVRDVLFFAYMDLLQDETDYLLKKFDEPALEEVR